eukprot:1503847-Rhodomonas_salina.2
MRASGLHACYALSGTGHRVSHMRAIGLRARYAMSGTDAGDCTARRTCMTAFMPAQYRPPSVLRF